MQVYYMRVVEGSAIGFPQPRPHVLTIGEARVPCAHMSDDDLWQLGQWRRVDAAAGYDPIWHIAIGGGSYDPESGMVTPAFEYRPLELIIERRLADLALQRYKVEIAGIELNDAVIRTDEGSQAKVNGAYAMVQLNPALVIDWKAASGWTQLDAAAMTAIAAAVGAHVQACYSAERAHGEALEALASNEDIEGLIAYDITDGWPPTAGQE
ncbi:DUF4376 domain-containing protein [Ferrovibrio sp.]|uniref:DUF4376 domain-containing protein n=1 Tax=Ferrovibrio sp. TaxID=1917215 RepID=UPI0035ADA53D